MSVTIWKNEQARERLERWYSHFLLRVPEPVAHSEVATRYGPSHVLVSGSDTLPPLVCLHPMRTSSAHVLSELAPLASSFRLIAPDLPWQSVRGLQVRLPLHDDSSALWLLDIFDGLGLAHTDLFGVSWGGYVARLTASTAPDRVRRLGLLVPAGVVNGSHWKGLTRMALPMIQYRLWQSDRNLRRLLAPLLTTWDEDWAGYTGDALQDMPMDLRIPPLATDEELRRLTMPTLVLGAADDISFPGEPLVRRFKTLIPHADGEVIAGCKHCPPTTFAFRSWLAARLEAFFAVTQNA